MAVTGCFGLRWILFGSMHAYILYSFPAKATNGFCCVIIIEREGERLINAWILYNARLFVA